MNELTKKIEVLLFTANEPVSKEKIEKVLDINQDQITSALEELGQSYQNHAVELLEVANGYMLATRPQYGDILTAVVSIPQELSLSSAALETLAIIAYKQPITRTQIEEIRGVNSDSMVKSLVDKMLVFESGISEAVGRPALYSTTDYFLEQFGLKNSEEIRNYFEENILKKA